MRTNIVRNASPKPFDEQKKAAAIALIEQGYSLNKTARIIGISNANPIRNYLLKEHPKVYQIALENGARNKNISRRGLQ